MALTGQYLLSGEMDRTLIEMAECFRDNRLILFAQQIREHFVRHVRGIFQRMQPFGNCLHRPCERFIAALYFVLKTLIDLDEPTIGL